MSEIMTASAEWSKRPADERFTSLHALAERTSHMRRTSRSAVVSNRSFDVTPGRWAKPAPVSAPHDDTQERVGSTGAAPSNGDAIADHALSLLLRQPLAKQPANAGAESTFTTDETATGLALISKAGHAYRPSHHAFSQLAQLAGAPAGYLRSLPAAMTADCLNYGLHHARDVEEIGLLLQRNGDSTLRAATGPNYGRIWDDEIVSTLVDLYGDGVSGRFRVPGEFGRRVPVTQANTTLYAGDRDMFVFLTDEENRIEVSNRRNGESGALARGFLVYNSEVGSRSFGIETFLFDYVCMNRIIWGATNHQTFRMRHTSGAPDRWLEKLQPALRAYADASTEGVTDLIAAAQAKGIATALGAYGATQGRELNHHGEPIASGMSRTPDPSRIREEQYRGAPMGVADYTSPDTTPQDALHFGIRYVSLDDGGYAADGIYWGVGAKLWHARGDDAANDSVLVSRWFRAPTYAHAVDIVRREFPKCTTQRVS